MKSFRKTAILALFGLIALLAFPLTASASSTFQAVNAGFVGSADATASAGTLVRKSGEARGRAQHGKGPPGHGSISLQLALTGLDANASYSVWWIIFNAGNPCIADQNCMGPDLNGVVNAGGFVTGADGTANMTAELDVGPISTGKVVFGALMDSFRDEIHIVIQSHGDYEAGHVAEQISIAGEFCNLADCSLADQQFVIFPPMMP
jgi:hypothetical protein